MKKTIIYIGAIILIANCIIPKFASAETQNVADLQAQIKALMQQIQILQEKLAHAQGETQQWCYTFDKNFGVGSSGDDVTALFNALYTEGIKVPEKTDYYDESIASAVSAFQEKYRSEILDPVGLSTATGYVGTKTRAKLNALYGCGKKGQSTPIVQRQSTQPTAKPAHVLPQTTTASCSQSPVSELQIADVAGVQSIYSPNEQIVLSIKAIRLPDGSASSPSCGFNIQAAIFDQKRTTTYASVNGTYNNDTGLWSVVMSAPTDISRMYDMQIFLYCGNTLCGMNENGSIGTAPAQKIKTFSFSLTGAQINTPPKPPPAVSEQIKCLFNGSISTQTCFAATDNSLYQGKSCSGVDGCIVDLTGNYNDKITWKSSCGGYATTLMDGVNEYAIFTCNPIPPSPSPVPLNTATTVNQIISQNTSPVISQVSGTGLSADASSGMIYAGQNATYTVTAVDWDSDDYIEYVTFDWHDGSLPAIFGPKNYNKMSVSASHTWSSPGTFTLTIIVKDRHGNITQQSIPITVSGIMPQVTLHIQQIKGYDPVTGVYTLQYAKANKQLVLYGTFPVSGNIVYIGDKKFTPIATSINDLWIQLDSQVPGNNYYSIYVTNGNTQSNTITFPIMP